MRLDVESMPLLVYEQLTVDKISEDEVMAECYDKVMTGEFSQFNEDKVLLVHDQLKLDNSNEVEVMVECHDSKYETSHHITDFVKISDSSLSSVGSARVQVNLLVDRVLHGWTRALRIINYLLAVPKKVKHRTHLIPDENCQVC